MNWPEYLIRYISNIDILTDIDFRLSFATHNDRVDALLDIIDTDIEEFYIYERENNNKEIKYYIQGFLIFEEISENKYLTIKDLILTYNYIDKLHNKYIITFTNLRDKILFLKDVMNSNIKYNSIYTNNNKQLKIEIYEE